MVIPNSPTVSQVLTNDKEPKETTRKAGRLKGSKTKKPEGESMSSTCNLRKRN